MMSGYIAAHYIAQAVEQNRYDKEMFATYDREINRRLQDDVKKYNFLRKVSPMLYNVAINVLSATGIAGYYFNRSVKHWIDTAKSKPIDIDFK